MGNLQCVPDKQEPEPANQFGRNVVAGKCLGGSEIGDCQRVERKEACLAQSRLPELDPGNRARGQPGIEPAPLFECVEICSGDDNVLRDFERNEMNGNSRAEHAVDSLRIFSDVEVVEMHHGPVAHTKYLVGLLPCDGNDAVDLKSQMPILSQQYCYVGERAERQDCQPLRGESPC